MKYQKEMEVNKGHILTAWVILDAYMGGKFENQFEMDMRANGMDELEIKKIIMNTKLLKIPRKEWTTKDVSILAQIISYIFFHLCRRQDELDKCLYEIDKRAKKEVIQNIMADDDYFTYRKAGKELKRIIEYVWKEDREYQMVFDGDTIRVI